MNSEREEASQRIDVRPEVRIKVDPENLKANPQNIYEGVIFEGLENVEMLDDFYIHLASSGYLNFGARGPIDLAFPFYRKEYRQQIKRPVHSKRVPNSHALPSYFLDYMAEKNKFFGKLKNYTLEILPPQSEEPIELKSVRSAKGNAIEGLGVLTTAEMHSSGRGSIGTLSTHTRSFFTAHELPDSFEYTKATYLTIPLSDDQAVNAMENLRNEGMKREGERILRAFSAGLPTLGKRR